MPFFARCFLVILLFALPVAAKVPLEKTERVPLPKQDLDKKYSYKEMTALVPDNIQQEEDSYVALRKFADRGLVMWWNSPQVQSAAVARTTDRAEKKLKADVTVRDASQSDHRFTFNVGAIQGMARLKYSGLTNMELKYEARRSQTGVEVSEKIWQDKKIIFGHYLNPVQSLSSVGLRWQF